MQLGEVAGVDVDRRGHVFVFHRPGRGFEPGATELLDQPAVLEFDEKSGEFVAAWGARTFLVPHGITVDGGGNVWVTDVGLHQVFKFSHDGRLLLSLGTPRVGGWDATHFNQPTDIAIERDGTFFVSDGYINSRVARFDPSGRFLGEWGKKGAGESQFSNPHGLAFAPNGDVLVADRENSRIQLFDRAGTFKRQWLGAKATGRVFSVAVDPAGAMYVGVRARGLRSAVERCAEAGSRVERDGLGRVRRRGRSGVQRSARPRDRSRRLDLHRRNAHEARRQASSGPSVFSLTTMCTTFRR